MSATMLPPSGDVPERPGGAAGRHAAVPASVTCDASGMEEIHRMFRAGFGEGPDLMAAVSSRRCRACRRGRRPPRDAVDRPARAPRGRGRAPLGQARAARAGVRGACRAHEVAARRDARLSRGARRGAAGLAGEWPMTDAARARGARRRERGARRAPRDEETNIVPVMETRSPRRRSTGSASTGARPRRRADVPAARRDPRGSARRRCRVAAQAPAGAGAPDLEDRGQAEVPANRAALEGSAARR